MVQLLTDKVTSSLLGFGLVKDKRRKDFLCSYLISLALSRSVQFHKAAEHLNSAAKVSSNTTRIQDFYREVEIDYHALACLLYTLLPKNGKFRVTIDRTEWDFGKTQVNILMVLVGVGDFQIPLYWELLDNNSGCSSFQNRIDLLELLLQVIPVHRIGIVLADREFIGLRWLSYLKQKGIGFCVRVPKNHHIERADGSIWTAEGILEAYPSGVQWENCRVDGIWGNVEIRPIVGIDGILFVFGTIKVALLAKLYRKRWGIEACFQQLKTRGFNLEDSHMYHLDRLKKLVGMIALSYGLCLSIGVYRHHKQKPISKKNHGYKSNSFFRHGLNYLTNLFSQRKPGFEQELREMVLKAAIFIQEEYEVLMTVQTVKLE